MGLPSLKDEMERAKRINGVFTYLLGGLVFIWVLSLLFCLFL